MIELPPQFKAHRRFWIGFTLAVVSFAAVAFTSDGPGVTWDEPYSIASSELYIDWYLDCAERFDSEKIKEYWAPNREHPPLAKTMMGFVRKVPAALAGIRGNVPPSRLSTAIFFTALQVSLFLIVAGGAGAAAGAASCLCLLLMPRVFGHAHLAVLDVPLACMWLWTTLAFVLGINSRRWSIATGVIFGLALLTKFDAVLIPIPLVIWGLIYHPRKIRQNLFSMAVIGQIVFFIGWPWLWDDTWQRLKYYVMDKLARVDTDEWIVQSYYFGKVYADRYPPWHYPIVMTLITIPVGILAAIAAGAVQSIRDARLKPFYGLVLISTGSILGLVSLPFTPKYDGVRLFLSLFPFLAMLGGVGCVWAWKMMWSSLSRLLIHWQAESLPHKKLAMWSAIAVVAAFFASQAVGICLMHPCELGYYNLLVGGPQGAGKLGMEPTYWGDSVTWEAFDWLRADHRSSRKARVAFFPKSEFIDGIWLHDGYLNSKRMQIVKFEDRWDYAVLFARRSMIVGNREASKLWDEAEPAWRFTRGGVDLCRIYRRQ